MANPYAFRYTLSTEAVDNGVLKWINERSPGHLVIRHDADEEVKRDHWHALIWSDKKVPALRADFRKANPEVSGQGAYSLTEIKQTGEEDPVEMYERYMCHGKFDGDPVIVVSAHGAKYTPEWFREQNTAFYAARKEFKKKIEKRENSVNMVNELVQACDLAGIREKREIAGKLVDKYIAERRPLNTFFAKSVVNTVWGVLNKGEARDALVDDICR